MTRRLVFLFTGLVLLLGLSGCWNRVEINDLAVITAVAVDRDEEGQVRLSAQVVLPTALGGAGGMAPGGGPGGGGGGGGGAGSAGGKAFYVVSESGRTLLDAVRRLQERVPRRLYFAHSRVVLLGERVAREGVTPVLDFFTRFREMRLNSFVGVVSGEARALLEVNPPLQRVPSKAISEEQRMRITVSTMMRDFLNMLLNAGNGAGPVAPRLEAAPADPLEAGGRREVAVSGAAVFRGDRMVGWLNDYEAQGLLWLRGELKNGVVTVKGPHGEPVSLQILRARTTLRPRIEAGQRLVMGVEIRVEGEVREVAGAVDLSDPVQLGRIEAAAAEEIEKCVRATAAKVQQEYGADVFGFGEAVRRTLPTAWKELRTDWPDRFREVELEPVTEVLIRRTGMTGRPAGVEEQEEGLMR